MSKLYTKKYYPVFVVGKVLDFIINNGKKFVVISYGKDKFFFTEPSLERSVEIGQVFKILADITKHDRILNYHDYNSIFYLSTPNFFSSVNTTKKESIIVLQGKFIQKNHSLIFIDNNQREYHVSFIHALDIDLSLIDSCFIEGELSITNDTLSIIISKIL